MTMAMVYAFFLITMLNLTFGADPCNVSSIGTFDWDDLTENGGTSIPDFDYSMTVDDKDLSLNIHVELEYLGLTSADNKDARWGTTYILDFESFNAHKDNIYEPGTCQNRNGDDFDSADFNSWWTYSETPLQAGHVGAVEYLSYPPTDGDNKWSISMGQDSDSCGYVVYDGHFTWQNLRECNNGKTPASPSYTNVVQDSNWLNLTGSFYINIVSPFDYKTDYSYYRVYQILSQPFVIAVSKTVYVLGAAGINLLTMSIIAVYKEDDENTFRLIVLTESSDYLKLSRSQNKLAGFTPNGAGLSQNDFEAILVAETANEALTNTPQGCLNNKDFLCSQLWEIRAENVDCSKNPNGINFSGKYTLAFDTECRSDTDTSISTDLASYCGNWLDAHQDIKDGVTLSADLVWKDEICDPAIFTEEGQFDASMAFYVDGFNNLAANDELYKVGVDKIYVLITTDFPDGTFDVFDTKLMNVWICTFDPLYYDSVTDPDPNEFAGGCYDAQRDGGLAVDNKYFYHIYDFDTGDKKEGFTLDDSLGGHPSDIDEDKAKLQFYFTVPHHIARDRLYIHAQIEVSLTELNRRRRLLVNTGTGTSIANQINHFIDSVGIGDGTEKEPKQEPPINNQPPPKQEPFNYNPPQQPPQEPIPTTWTINLSSPWILIIGAALSIILIFNIGLMCYMNCFKTKQQRNRVSFNSTRRSGYSSVKHIDNSEYDDSENHPINI